MVLWSARVLRALWQPSGPVRLCDYKVKRVMKERKVVIKLLGTPSLNVDSNAIVMVRGEKE